MTIASTVSTAPTIRIRKAAGPSPTLKLSKSSPHALQRWANRTTPANSDAFAHRGHLPASAWASGEGLLTPPVPPSARVRRAPAAPHVDGDEQEQPDDVDEVPVPGGRFEAEVLLRREVALVGADQADQQEDGADDH